MFLSAPRSTRLAMAAAACLILFQPLPALSAKPVPPPPGNKPPRTGALPQNGVFAIVYDAQGNSYVVDREGRLLPPCQPCTEELERVFGRGCREMPKAAGEPGAAASGDAAAGPSATAPATGTAPATATASAPAQPEPGAAAGAQAPAPAGNLCRSAVGTTVRKIDSLGVVRHSGSQCYLVERNVDGKQVYVDVCFGR